MRSRYKTEARRILEALLPKKGFLNVKELARKARLSLDTVYYQLRTMSKDVNSAIANIKIGLKKSAYFVKKIIDHWVFQKLQRITLTVLKFKNLTTSKLTAQAKTTG